MEAVDLIQRPEPRYVGEKCPTCNNHSRDTHYIVFYILIGIVVLLFLLLGVTYFKYLMSHQEVSTCRDLHNEHYARYHAREEDSDDFYDTVKKLKQKKKSQ